ncbi:MAG: N-acetylglucosamine-6-phosphate deacetylase [Alphaproteobacteria bacterium]
MLETVGNSFSEPCVVAGKKCFQISVSGTGCITSLTKTSTAPGASFVTPGFFDLQVNGFAGVDFNAPGLTPDRLDHALGAMLATGVTKCLATIITALPDRLTELFESLETSVRKSRLGPVMVAGFHLEGPFISPKDGYRGCHPAEAICAADSMLFERCQEAANGNIVLVSLAPEVEGALDLITHLRARSITVALAHTDAPRSIIGKAVQRGARLATHLGNATARTLPKHDNVILHQLFQENLHASFIADGHHVPLDVLAMYVGAKSVKKSILVSDAMAGALAPPGDYTLGDLVISRGAEPVMRQPGTQNLAGAALGLDQALRNLAAADFTIADIVTMAAVNPRALLGAGPALQTGAPAELVWWEPSEIGAQARAAQVGPLRWADGSTN